MLSSLSKFHIQNSTQQRDSFVSSLSLSLSLFNFRYISASSFLFSSLYTDTHFSVTYIYFLTTNDSMNSAVAPQSTHTALTIVSVSDTQCYAFYNLSLPVCYDTPVFLYSDAALTALDFSTILSPSALLQPNSDVPPCSLVHRQQITVAVLVTPHILDSRRYISWFTSLIIANFAVSVTLSSTAVRY